MDLTDKRVLVMGGARGIGFGIAKVSIEAGNANLSWLV